MLCLRSLRRSNRQHPATKTKHWFRNSNEQLHNVAQLPSRLSAPKSATGNTGNTGNTVILLRGGLIATRRACLARNRAVTMCQVQTLQAPHTMLFSKQFQSPHMTQSWGKLRFFDIPESTFYVRKGLVEESSARMILNRWFFVFASNC